MGDEDHAVIYTRRFTLDPVGLWQHVHERAEHHGAIDLGDGGPSCSRFVDGSGRSGICLA